MSVLQTNLVSHRAALRLNPAQDALFNAALGDLGDLVHLNERRFWRVMGSGPISASAVQGLEHQLKAEQGASRAAANAAQHGSYADPQAEQARS